MPAKDGKVITVAPSFAAMIDNGLDKTNTLLNSKLKKKMTKIDYTDFLARVMKDDFGLFLTRGMVMPFKKGRRSKKVVLYPSF